MKFNCRPFHGRESTVCAIEPNAGETAMLWRLRIACMWMWVHMRMSIGIAVVDKTQRACGCVTGVFQQSSGWMFGVANAMFLELLSRLI